jgi:glucan endo-1,3-alpha-glucosidase
MKFWPRTLSRVSTFLIAFCALVTPAFAQKTVFAHFMLANQDYVPDDAPTETVIASYEQEIRQAQAIGIDGFALNAGGWFKEPRYIKRASEMFEAAYRLNSNFKLMFSADMCCSNDAEDVEDMVRRFANNPRYAAVHYRRGDKVFLTTFAGEKHGPEFWSKLRRDLEQGSNPSTRNAPNALEYVSGVPSSKPIKIFLVPAFFWGGELPRKPDIETGLADYADIIDGALYWGIAAVPGLGHPPDQIPSADAYSSVLHRAGKLYIAPICLQFWGANAGRYYEYGGYAGMRAMWMDAIDVTHPEAVEIITWNDFIEGTYISPIDDPARYTGANDLDASAAPPSTLHYFHPHQGASELLAYFIQWYKTGVQPAIRKDSVFWAYRTVLQIEDGKKPAIKIEGPVENVVYITANLVAPAVLRVTSDGKTKAIALPAGSSDIHVPLRAGPAPMFALVRGSHRLAQASGDDPISAVATHPNLYYSTGATHD